MGLNIKNEEAHRLATRVAELTGESLTDAVVIALRERVQRIEEQRQNEKDKRFEDMMRLARDFRAQLTGPLPDHGEFLYDEHGLPK